MQNKSKLSETNNNFSDLHLIDWDDEKIVYQLNSPEQRVLKLNISDVESFAKNTNQLVVDFPEVRGGEFKDNEETLEFVDWFTVSFLHDPVIVLEYLKSKLI